MLPGPSFDVLARDQSVSHLEQPIKSTVQPFPLFESRSPGHYAMSQLSQDQIPESQGHYPQRVNTYPYQPIQGSPWWSSGQNSMLSRLKPGNSDPASHVAYPKKKKRYEVGIINIINSILWMRTLSLREVPCLAQVTQFVSDQDITQTRQCDSKPFPYIAVFYLGGESEVPQSEGGYPGGQEISSNTAIQVSPLISTSYTAALYNSTYSESTNQFSKTLPIHVVV